MCGDSTNYDDMNKLMGTNKADLLITDPPYNVNYEGKAGKIANDQMAKEKYKQFLVKAFCLAKEHLRAGGSFYIWHADSESFWVRGALLEIGLRIRQCLIWNKNSLVMGRQDYHWKHEVCLYGWNDGAAHFWNNNRKQTTVIDFKRPIRSALHPTMKPIGLFEYLIGNNTKEDDVVLDSFGGSGTTIIACENTNRRAIVMEIDENYANVILARYVEAYGTEGVRLVGLINER